MQPNDESSVKNILDKENEILLALFPNIFGVIILIISTCYHLPMLPVSMRVLQVNTLYSSSLHTLLC